jgi:hypothetical protein
VAQGWQAIPDGDQADRKAAHAHAGLLAVVTQSLDVRLVDSAQPGEESMTDITHILTDRELVQRALRREFNLRENADRPQWAVAMNLFGCGSDMAERVCYEYGLDPDRSCSEFDKP